MHRDLAAVVTADDRQAISGLRARFEADPGWRVHDIPTGHNAMREAPEAGAELLLDRVRPRA